MAFLDFTQPIPGLSGQMSTPRGGAVGVEGTFGAVEWQIIHLARKDGLASLRESDLFGRILAAIFGPRPRLKLANERLEALRRLAVEAWHRGYAVSLSALAAFKAAGFSIAQLELLLGTISADRAARGRRTFA